MSDQSLDTLVAWLGQQSRMLGWGMIVALERDKANLLLRHEYISRFAGTTYLKPISGSVQNVENEWRVILHNFVFDAPRLSFENADLDDGRAKLSMDLMGGNFVTMEASGVGWQIRKIESFDTLMGARLYMDLQLAKVPGKVGPQGEVELDLRHSDDFEFALTARPELNELIADAFKQFFHRLADDRRVYPLLTIPEGVEASLRPTRVALRTQKNPSAAVAPEAQSYGSGAVLVFGRLDDEAPENDLFPGPGYHYLIPDDVGKGYSGTVLLERQKTLIAINVDYQLLEQVAGVIGASPTQFLVFPNTFTGHFANATAQAGTVRSNGYVWTGPELWADDKDAIGASRTVFEAVAFPAARALRLTYPATDTYRLHWQKTVNRQSVLNPFPDFLPDKTDRLQHTLTLDAEYSIGRGTQLRITTSAISFAVNHQTPTVTCNYGDEPRSEAQRKRECNQLKEALEHSQILGLAASYDAWLNGPLKTTFSLRHSLDPSILALLDRAFDRSFLPIDLRSPLDIAAFGRVNPDRTAFEVAPQEWTLAPLTTREFTTIPPRENVTWDVENIDPASTAPAGNILPSGMYHAPAGTSIIGSHTRVRVIATCDDGIAHGLITVVRNALNINPLIATCEALATAQAQAVEVNVVNLIAGALDLEPGHKMLWDIPNPVAGESGTLVPSADGTCVYTAHERVRGKTFVLDKVEVAVEIDVGGDVIRRERTAWVLAIQHKPGLDISIVDLRPEPGTLVLRARLSNGNSIAATWTLGAGSPGCIDANGVYEAGEVAAQPFALVFAAYDGDFDLYEGYLIIPLPLLDHPEELILLSQPEPAPAA